MIRVFRSLTLTLAALAAGSSLAQAQSLYNPYLFTSPSVVGTLSSNPYATPPPVIPYRTPSLPTYPTTIAPLTPPLASAPAIVGRDGTYLGILSSNPYDPNSVANPYGRYGSPYSSDSINNPYGRYGSPYSTLSPTNPYATQPPLLIGR